nr:low affinity immunoglobulin epsilon Fc receptor-like [Pocillopora verrucosa]
MQGMSLDQPLTFAPLDGCIGITRVTTLLYFESSRVAWQDARQACQRIRGGDLVSIHSAAENDCIEHHISGPCWIGLNDLRTEGNFQWSNGSSSVYKSYSNNEPNDFHGQEDCVEIRSWLADTIIPDLNVNPSEPKPSPPKEIVKFGT